MKLKLSALVAGALCACFFVGSRAMALDAALRALSLASNGPCEGPALRPVTEECPGLSHAVCAVSPESKVAVHLLGHTMLLEGEVDSVETKDKIEHVATQYLAQHCPGRAPATFEASRSRPAPPQAE